uniref:ASCH domain-containing protein n=1 Tax=uncultured Spirochaetaceae bacterium TaxID=201186 RepID=A0A650EPI2_9SPIO|nr:hypothetical protein Unknown280_0440 [uncultured Spirochaetaceae bacterium]
MLTFNLKKQWYDKIASGEKRIEYREANPYWTKRIEKVWTLKDRFFSLTQPKNCLHIPCVFRLGYTRKYLNAVIDEIHIVDGKETDLCVDKPVYAMHFELEEE